jgi:ABC-type bacteriocin/lantibiotic exporter with double-glycine peptidase domain
MNYLAVPHFGQSTDFTCGPASLQMVLAFYAMHLSEAELSFLLDTDAQVGTTKAKMEEVAQAHHLHTYSKENADIADIKELLLQNIPIIVRYLELEKDEDHYGVVVALSDTDIVINDPWHGERYMLPLEEFEKRWKCSAYEVCEKWLLAVSDKPIVA